MVWGTEGGAESQDSGMASKENEKKTKSVLVGLCVRLGLSETSDRALVGVPLQDRVAVGIATHYGLARREGTFTAAMPVAFAATIPNLPSSNTRHDSGLTSRRPAAIKKASGAGLPSL